MANGKKKVSVAEVDADVDGGNADGDLDLFDIEEDTGPADDPTHWLNMLRDLKGKPKASAAQTASASARTRQINAHARQHREQATAFVEDMRAFLDKFVSDSQERKNAQSKEYGDGGAWTIQFQAAARRAKAANDALMDATRLTPKTDPAGDLPQRREDDIERACARIQSAPRRRAKAHRRVLRGVREELDAVLEQEKVVADATKLVGHVKRLLRG